MSVFELFHFNQKDLYEVYCPLCGKWACDTNLKLGLIVLPCRECRKKLVIMNWGDGPFVFRDRRKKARVPVRANNS
jgi:hypothetical protein